MRAWMSLNNLSKFPSFGRRLPVFIHPLTDGVPRIESKVLKSVIDVVYEMVIGKISISFLELKRWGFNMLAVGTQS